MSMLQNAQPHRAQAVLVVPMFSVVVRATWLLLLVFTLFSELVPLSLAFESRFPTFVFHSYEVAKLVFIFAFGFLTPIAWWCYKNLGMGVLFAAITTAIVEFGQAFIPGHRTSAMELWVKLVLLFIGFAAGLDVRKYQVLNLGLLSVRFSSRYW